jgi:hypothetical protein
MNALQRIPTMMGPIVEQFNPDILKNGTDEEKNQQLINWAYGDSNSIFVRWIPDEMLPNASGNDSVARNFFGLFGDVARLDFVPKFNAQGKRSGHMAFIHYTTLYERPAIQQIVDAHPAPADFAWSPYTNSVRTYKISCCVNTRPVAKVEFNTSQLTDMIQNLNMRLTVELKEKDAVISNLQAAVDKLEGANEELRDMILPLVLKVENLTCFCQNEEDVEDENDCGECGKGLTDLYNKKVVGDMICDACYEEALETEPHQEACYDAK